MAGSPTERSLPARTAGRKVEGAHDVFGVAACGLSLHRGIRQDTMHACEN